MGRNSLLLKSLGTDYLYFVPPKIPGDVVAFSDFDSLLRRMATEDIMEGNWSSIELPLDDILFKDDVNTSFPEIHLDAIVLQLVGGSKCRNT